MAGEIEEIWYNPMNDKLYLVTTGTCLYSEIKTGKVYIGYL